MEMELTPNEIRVLGCLLEKEITTPEQYPLSLNALVNACNQKSNREPVMELNEGAVRTTLDELIKKRLVREESGFGSRVPKFQHRFCNTEFGSLKLSPQEVGILCTLFLRGPQTPGELRSRSSRLCQFADMQEVDATLHGLQQHSTGPLVTQLAREPGKRESRYAHLFGEIVAPEPDARLPEVVEDASHEARLTALEQQVADLRGELDELKQQLADLMD